MSDDVDADKLAAGADKPAVSPVQPAKAPHEVFSSGERLVSIASPILLLLAWELSARAHLIDVRILPAPSVVLATIWELLREGQLAGDVRDTVVRFLIGLVFGVVPGVFIGATMGLFRWPRAALGPLVAMLYNVPRIALFPLVLILVGLNEFSNELMIALGPFFTMLITTMGAVMNVEPAYRDVARNFNTGTRHLYTLVVLPAITPALMDGLRLSLGLALLGTITVEFLVGDSGLGHLIWNSWTVLSLKQSMAGLIVATIVGAFFYASLSWLERLLIPWR
ncbi:MAG: transporter permease [Rhodospirillales bacterium]|nr:transporter permease [Rhodospirillales bacterium]